MYDQLSDFLAELQDDGELIRVPSEVDPRFEVTEITDHVCKQTGGGPALFFENVKGSTMPIVTNLLGSEHRICKALRCQSLEEIGRRIAAVVQPDIPEGWLERLKLVPQLAQLTRVPPKIVKTAACQQVVKLGRDVDLGTLPFPHCWPDESGATITWGQVFTKDPSTGVRNVGLYPLQQRDRASLSVHWTVHQDAWRHFVEYQKRNRQMPLAVALGGDPVISYSASAPLPPNTDECLLAGFLRGSPVELVKCRSVELEVPAQAEIIIEGYIDTAAPFEPAAAIASPTGFYVPEEPLPVMHITGVTHRSNPIVPALVYGPPPMEDYWLGKASERIFLPLVRLFSPEIVDYHMPRSGVFRNLLFVGIHKEYPHHARKVMNAIWSLGWLMVSKMIVLVDADVDVRNEEQVWFHVGANVHPGRDVIFSEGPADMRDHAAPVRGMGHKMGIDATRKLADEGHPRVWPTALSMRDDVRQQVRRRWSEYGLGEIDPPISRDRRVEGQ